METRTVFKQSRTFLTKERKEVLDYESLQQYKKSQEQLIAAGIINRPHRIIRDFTATEQAEFDKGLSLEKVFAKLSSFA